MNSRPRHILVLTSVYPLALTTDRYGSFIHETIKHVETADLQFSVFAPAYQGMDHQTLEGIPVYRFRYCWKRWEILTHHGDGAPTKVTQNPLYLLLSALYILAGTLQLLWLCRRLRPDVLHVNWPFPHGLMAYPAHKLLGIPMVFTFHGAGLLLAQKFPWIRWLLKGLLPQADQVTANSSFTQNLIGAIAPTPVQVIPYGLTIEAQPTHRLPQAIPKLLYVGRLLERKGIRYLLEAMPEVLAHHPAELRIVGNGDLMLELQTLAQTLGIQASVHFLGFVPNETLVQEYANCDVFVLPAIEDRKGDTEGLGIVMIEALAHEKPVIASQVGGIVDVVRPHQTGLLVPQKDPQALARAIVHLLAHPDLAAIYGRTGRQDVLRRFGWAGIATQWQRIFRPQDAHSPTPDSPAPLTLCGAKQTPFTQR